MTFHHEIFRAYDIRGIVGESLTADMVRDIGRSLGAEMLAQGVNVAAVGWDGRVSSPDLSDALCAGLISTGCDIVKVGQVPTPTLYHAATCIAGGTGFQITGSHNPSQYNGLKMMINRETLYGEKIQALKRKVIAGDFPHGDGRLSACEVRSDYLESILDDIRLEKSFRVVIDCGNGVAGAIAPEVFRRLGCDVIELYCEVDGAFPNHHPDPSQPGNLEDLIEAVRDSAADIGMAFDGDGDRLGVVSPCGRIIWPDRQMALFSRSVLEENPGASIIFDVKCSQILAKSIIEAGGVPIMWKTGHSFMKEKLRETGAPLAGEMSGHIFFNDRWGGFDDGIYAAARLLELLGRRDEAAEEVFSAIPDTVNTPELKIDLPEGEPFRLVDDLVRSARFDDAEVSLIDGLRVDFRDGFGLVRASNTTPSVIMRFESSNETTLKSIMNRFRRKLERVRPGLAIPF